MSQTESSAPRTDGILIVGSTTADLTTFSHRLPSPGETILGDDFTLVLGGKGANQAIAAALAGGSAYMVSCVGTDLFAPMLTDGLQQAGVNIEHVAQVPGPSGIAHIRVDDSGENDIVMVPLANAALSAAQIDAAFLARASSSKVLLTQLEIPWALTQHAIRRAHECGLIVILDPAPATPLDEAIWPLVDIVTPNETEASRLTGIVVSDADSATAAGRWFTARGAGHALITMASAGAILVSETATQHFPAIPVVAVDTTAAGDAFAGYLGAALARGDDLADAISQAMAAGALTVTQRGASPSLPQRAAVEALLDVYAGVAH
ncbi:ribokinase [Cryobacterium serini]|uniref:Ribokinase n=1 Tax=Cryobacterium serini TaxID=1259201 RepID=A0A4R9BSA6_9MICO|nr:ribokinase [Cryobacterium serini]TFD90019.1 ribokinase [Cryobacterium serini]